MNLKELKAIAAKEKRQQQKTYIRCCTVGGCLSANGIAVKEKLEAAIAEAGLGEEIAVSGVGCMGLCSKGPLVRVDPQGTLYDQVTPSIASAIVASVTTSSEHQSTIVSSPEQADSHPFLTQQLKIVLENSGKIDPETIEEYIAADGYLGLYKLLREMTLESLVEIISHMVSEIVASVTTSSEHQSTIVSSPEQADSHPFLTQQLKIVLENSGKIDPETIEEYIAADGYLGLYKLLREMTLESLVEIISHMVSGIVTYIATSGERQLPPIASAHQPDSHPFFTQQLKIVLENSGKINPEKIEEYIAADGYRGLYQVLHEMDAKSVLETISRSGLRGRGGAGYPTGLKWETVAKAISDRKFVICNADEGDPGAFMDRSVLESDPHRLIEGMAIAAYAVGANQGYIYVRGEYPLAISHLQTAIRQAKRLGLLGSQIFESPFDFKIDLRIGAGAFVCGEETALMASIEGKRGIPRPRPPYPAESGLWGYPTLINNVETFANVPTIIRRGADWFASIGTANSKGTKVFSLAGKVNNTGLIEVPMGTTLQHIVEDMGGGVPQGGKAKAVQTGGPSGGCIPAKAFDTPVDYESLKELGSIMGSGGAIVMDESTNMVDVARFFMEFCMDESCGKCIPCRAGTVQLYQLLTKISQGKATINDLDKLEELCDMVKHTSLCGLGQSAPNPVFSTLRYFRDEYLALIST